MSLRAGNNGSVLPLRLRVDDYGVASRSGLFDSVMVASSVACILIPTHPSLQALLADLGIPSTIVSAALAVPVLIALATKKFHSPEFFALVLPLSALVVWLIARSILSPALLHENYIASVRSLAVITPLAVSAALVANLHAKLAARLILSVGLVAAIHVSIGLLFGDLQIGAGAFLSLSSDAERQNYQSTGFYLGLVAVGAGVAAINRKGLARSIGWVGAIVGLGLMGLVGARSSIVAAIGSITCISLLFHGFRAIRAALIGGLVLGLVYLAFQPTALFDTSAASGYFLAIDRFMALADGDSSSRIFLFKSALMQWTDSYVNLLFGAGLGSFPGFIGEGTDGWYPHNFVLESLAEGGAIAGALLFAIALPVGRRVLACRRSDMTFEYWYLAALALYAVIAYQFMGGLQSIWIPVFFVSVFALGASARTQ